MVKSEVQNLVLSIIIFITLIMKTILKSQINLVFILLSGMLISLICYILLDKKPTGMRFIHLPGILLVMLITISILPQLSNILGIIVSVLFSFLLLYFVFRDFDNYPFHPALLTWMFFALCFPEQITNSSKIFEDSNIYSFITSNDIMTIIKEFIPTIGFIIAGVVGIFFRRVNVLTAVTFIIILSLIQIAANDLNPLYNNMFIIGGLFLLADSYTSPCYKLSSIVSGLLAVLLFMFLNTITSISIAFIVDFTIISLLNPLLDKSLLSINKLRNKNLENIK